MIELTATLVVVCAATSFVCCAVKEDEDAHLVRSTARLFVYMAGGIAAFAGAVHALTTLAT